MRCVLRVCVLAMLVVLSGFVGARGAAAQNPTVWQSNAASAAPRQESESQTAATEPAASPSDANHIAVNSSSLLLGPGDELEITVYGAPDLSGRTRIGETGNISMPLIGYVRVAGLSTSEAEAAIEAQLRQNNIVKEPQVSIYAKDFTNSGISVAGEVAKPGFYSALGPHRLFDVLQLAGGITDKASNMVSISHRDQQEGVTVTVSRDPAEMGTRNVELKPGDTVVVPRAGIAYVLGEVTRPGGYVLNSTGGITVLQVVAAAGGPTHLASYGKTTLLHRTATGFQEQKLDLKKLLRGRTQDIAVKNDDILFIPTSGIKSALNASALVGAAGTAAIYHVPF
jgi:polysaccharide biosynthesis/export protein